MIFSGLTVVASLAGLLLIDTTILRSMALGSILVVAVSVLTASTLLPTTTIEWRADSSQIAFSAAVAALRTSGGNAAMNDVDHISGSTTSRAPAAAASARPALALARLAATSPRRTSNWTQAANCGTGMSSF